MADYDVRQDSKTASMTLQAAWYFRLFGVILAIASLIGITSRSTPAIVLGFIFSLFALWMLLYQDSTTLDPSRRVMRKTKGLPFFTTRTLLPFDQITNIAVEYYVLRGRYGPGDEWRVQAVDRAGIKYLLSARGGREEMLRLGQKIATLTGAPLLDHSEKVTK